MLVNQVRGKKKMRLFLDKNPPYDGYWIFVANKSIGWVINIDKYGYKTWSGDKHEVKYKNVQIGKLLNPGDAEELAFYDGDKGAHKLINPREIYYIYVVDKSGKTYRKYTHPRIISLCMKLRNILF